MNNTRNPSPPPDNTDNEPKFIYSESFILKTLLLVLKEGERVTENTDSDSTVDLDADFDEMLCSLWDMSADDSVVECLLENSCVEIFIRTTKSTNKPRLVEILVGTIGNLLCSSKSEQTFKENSDVLSLLLSLCACRDSSTLIETIRCLNTCLERSFFCPETWIANFDAFDVWPNLLFIVKFSLNAKLLLSTVRLIDNLLEVDTSDQIKTGFCSACPDFLAELINFLTSVETYDADLETSDRWCLRYHTFGVIHSLSTCQSSFDIFDKCKSDLQNVAVKVMDENFEDFDHTPFVVWTINACLSLLLWLANNQLLSDVENTAATLKSLQDRISSMQNSRQSSDELLHTCSNSISSILSMHKKIEL